MGGKMKELYQKNILDFLMLQRNKPYIWGNVGPDSFDCSGLTEYMYQELFNINIEENGYGIGDTTKQMTSPVGTSNRYPGHVGIYIGENQFIHASSDEEKVVITSLNDYWLNRLVGSKNILNTLIITKEL